MIKVDSKVVAIFKLIAVRDQASSLGKFVGSYNRGRAQETLLSFADRVDQLAREAIAADPASLNARVSRLRSECEQVILPAMVPPGRAHYLDEALALLGMVRNLDKYCLGGED